MLVLDSYGKNVYIGEELVGYIDRYGNMFINGKKFAFLTEDGKIMIEENYEELKKIYPKFLISSMFKFYDLKPTFNTEQLDFRKQNQLVQSFLPILNLIEITGLIKIILEFNEEQNTWDNIEKYWLDLLKREESFININFIHS